MGTGTFLSLIPKAEPMTSLQIIILVVLFICVLMWVLFRIKNKKMSLLFSKKIYTIYAELDTHSTQMDKRSLALNSYDFLKYNLGEVLLIQQQIKL